MDEEELAKRAIHEDSTRVPNRAPVTHKLTFQGIHHLGMAELISMLINDGLFEEYVIQEREVESQLRWQSGSIKRSLETQELR